LFDDRLKHPVDFFYAFNPLARFFTLQTLAQRADFDAVQDRPQAYVLSFEIAQRRTGAFSSPVALLFCNGRGGGGFFGSCHFFGFLLFEVGDH
jgi:hypothetical protein